MYIVEHFFNLKTFFVNKSIKYGSENVGLTGIKELMNYILTICQHFQWRMKHIVQHR